MKPEIWECSEQRIHVVHEGIEMQFKDIDAFIDSLVIWQEYALRYKFGSMDNLTQLWDAVSQDCKN